MIEKILESMVKKQRYPKNFFFGITFYVVFIMKIWARKKKYIKKGTKNTRFRAGYVPQE